MIAASTPSHTGVQVDNVDNERHGQAGYTLGMAKTDEGHPSDDFMTVHFDTDGVEEAVPLADLKRL